MIFLNKEPKNDFVILNLTDIQLSDEEWSGSDDRNRMIVIRTVLELVERVHPDLITITGDLSWSGNYTALTMLADFLNSLDIPWAPLWGNHDQDKGVDKIEYAVELFSGYSNFMFESGDPSLGVGNYVLAIREEDRIVAGVVMMDTHDKFPYRNEDGVETMEWAQVLPEQVVWYRQQIEELKEMGCQNTILMTHIPIYAYRPAIEAWKNAPGTQKMFSQEHDRDVYISAQGACYEGVCNYPVDDGMLEQIRALGSTKIVVAGHDHINNAIVDYQEVKFVYALNTGPGCYWKESLNGGTVFTVNSDGRIVVRHEYVAI